MPEAKRQLAAIMFTDIVGYTSLMGKDSEKALELVHISKEIQKPLVEKHNGKWLKEMGDGSLSSFGSALDAVNCSIEIQKSARAELDAKLRIGIHLGDVTVEENDVYGDGVNVASRLESIADPGGIYISDAIQKAVRGQANVQAKYLGEVRLKNVDYGVRTYALRGHGLPEPSVKLVLKRRSISKVGWIYMIAAFSLISLSVYFFAQNNMNKVDNDSVKTVAVLPFKNLSDDSETGYFVDGIMRVILDNLARIGDLEVTSGRAVEPYADGYSSAKEVGEELDVDYLIETSIQKIDNQIKIVVQLIDTRNERQIWDETYDEEWKDVLKLQSDLSLRIAEKLNTRITDPEIKMIRTAHETDPLAQDFLFKAWNFSNKGFERQDIEWAIEMAEKALAIDSSYALAWLALGNFERRLYNLGFEVGANQKKRVKEAFDRAFALRPDLPSVQESKADYLYSIEKDYPNALKIYEKLESQYPRRIGIKHIIALTHRRMGNFEKAEQINKEYVTLRPNNVWGWYSYGQILTWLRKYSEAEKAFSEAITVDPSFVYAYGELAEVQMDFDGDLHRARETWDHPFLQHRWRRLSQLEIRDRNFKRAIDLWKSAPEEGKVDQGIIIPKSLGLALVYHMAGNDSSQVLFEESLDPLLSKVEETPEDWRIYTSLGLAYSGIGDKQKATESIDRLAEILYNLHNIYVIANLEHGMIRIYIMLKEFNLALKLIKKHLDAPTFTNDFGSCSINDLKLHPMYDPLRDLPEFQEILEEPKYQIRK